MRGSLRSTVQSTRVTSHTPSSRTDQVKTVAASDKRSSASSLPKPVGMGKATATKRLISEDQTVVLKFDHDPGDFDDFTFKV